METQRLEIAENVSLVGSVLGTVAAVVLKQVGFAAVPLTLALALSLVNRRRFQQQTQEYTASAIAQTNHALQSLHQQIQTLPAITTHLEDLHQQFNARPETIAISQLTKNLDELTRRVERLPNPAEIDTTGFQQAISDIYTQLETLTQRIDNSLTSNQVDLSEIVQAIADINGQIDTLTSRFDQLPQATEANTSEVEQTIAYINSQLETLTSRVDRLPATTETDLSEVEQTIAYINSQLETLTSRVDSLPAAKEADVNEVEQVIAYINSQLETLHQEFNSRSETPAIAQLTLLMVYPLQPRLPSRASSKRSENSKLSWMTSLNSLLLDRKRSRSHS
jgi:chromosome segregation ATPase